MFARNAIALLVVFLMMSIPAEAQVARAGFYFRQINQSARSLGIGEATVALRGYPDAQHINPATIGFGKTVQIGSNFNASDRSIPLFSSDQSVLSSIDFWMREHWITGTYTPFSAAYEYKEFHLGTLDVLNANGQLIREADQYEVSHKITISQQIASYLAVGGGLTRIKSVISNGPSITAWSWDAGMQFDYPFVFRDFTLRPALGWSVTDYGPAARNEKALHGRVSLPMTLRAGLSLQIATTDGRFKRPWVRLGLHANQSRVLAALNERGEPDDPVETLFSSAWRPVLVNVGTTANPEFIEVSGFDLLTRHEGLDLALLDIFSLRFGRIKPSLDVGASNVETWGWGLDLFYVVVDYANVKRTVAIGPGERDVWNVTVRIPLGHNSKNFWTEVF